MTDAVSFLSHARYGKDKIRVFRVVRDGPWHNIVEYNVTALLEGDIETRYRSLRLRELGAEECLT